MFFDELMNQEDARKGWYKREVKVMTGNKVRVWVEPRVHSRLFSLTYGERAGDHVTVNFFYTAL